MEPEKITNTVEGRYWHMLDDGRVQCDLCPRYCKLQEGQRGLCFVRSRQAGKMVLTTYGRSSGFCIDPVEKKPLNHFLPGTPILSFGTAGCNLTCKFCQNWDISKSRAFDKLQARDSVFKLGLDHTKFQSWQDPMHHYSFKSHYSDPKLGPDQYGRPYMMSRA